MLEALAKDEPVVVAATLPKHLGTYVHADVTISLQSFLPGEPISKGVWRTPPAEVLSVVRAVADWFVARFAAREPTPAFPNHLTDTIAGRLWRRTPGQAAQQSFSQFVAEASHLRSECGVIHNDLHPGNLLFNRTARLSGVLDWEHAGYGPLLCDWFGFVNEYALWLLGERGGVAAVRRALENAWSRRSPLLAVAREQSLRIVANSKTTEAGVLACWRLASFRFAYARSHDERAVAQDLWIDALGRAPSFSRD